MHFIFDLRKFVDVSIANLIWAANFPHLRYFEQEFVILESIVNLEEVSWGIFLQFLHFLLVYPELKLPLCWSSGRSVSFTLRPFYCAQSQILLKFDWSDQFWFTYACIWAPMFSFTGWCLSLVRSFVDFSGLSFEMRFHLPCRRSCDHLYFMICFCRQDPLL